MITLDVREQLTAACAEAPRVRWLEYVDDLDVSRFVSRERLARLLRLTDGTRGRPYALVHFMTVHPETGRALLYPRVVLSWTRNPRAGAKRGYYVLEWRPDPWENPHVRGSTCIGRRPGDTSRVVTFTDRYGK